MAIGISGSDIIEKSTGIRDGFFCLFFYIILYIIPINLFIFAKSANMTPAIKVYDINIVH